MKQERVILSFIMVLIGLLVAGAAFYFYQSGNKTVSTHEAFISPTPKETENTNFKLVITNPTNESVTNSKTISLTGITDPTATVLVVTNIDQNVVSPKKDGSFSTNLTLSSDQNLITIISILPSGESKQTQITVTYSTVNF